MKVFISHSSRDKPLIREVLRHMTGRIETWFDEGDILAGEDLDLTIKLAIERAADLVVIFISEYALESKWVRRELEIALEHEERTGRLFVMPVLLDDVWDRVKPDQFRKRRYLRCFDRDESQIRWLAEALTDQLFGWALNLLEELKKRGALHLLSSRLKLED